MKRIKSIEIKNSTFFEDISIEFSDSLNCIMGGRGTGKTTLMCFIMSCLSVDAEDNKDIYNVLKENLGDGEFTLWVESNDSASYKIVKTFGDEPQPHLFPTSDFIPLNKIVSSVECDFYEAGKIEEIGRSKAERLTLLDKRIKPKISRLKDEMIDVQFDLDSNAQDIRNYISKLESMTEMQSQFIDVGEEFANHKLNQPETISDNDSKRFEKADGEEKIRNAEKRFFSKTFDFIEKLSTDVNDQISELKQFSLNNKEETGSFLNGNIVNAALEKYDSSFDAIGQHLELINKTANKLRDEFGSLFNQLVEQHDAQHAEFIKLKQTFEMNRDYVNKYHLLSKRVNDKEILSKEIEQLKLKKTYLDEKRVSLILNLNNIKSAIYKKRHENIAELNEQFGGSIIITLEFSGNTDDYEQLLRDSLRGSGLRYNELIPRIVSKFTPDSFAKVIHEKDITKLKEITGIDEARSATLINSLYNTDHVFEIEKLYCDDLPNFKLRIHGEDVVEENYRVTEELSLGQRCTTVLPIIFAISDNPLFIDQPEDNLDNKFISDQIHEIVRKQKQKRQIIFITHNPNIPVLSDAEQNTFLAYDRKSSVSSQGNITDVQDLIMGLLEGGKIAFETRMKKYGY